MTKKIIKSLSNHFVLSEEEFIKHLLKDFIIKKIKETNIKILHLQKKYKIKNILEFENLYKTNKIPEEGTWEDFQDLDHYEFVIDKFNNFMEQLKLL